MLPNCQLKSKLCGGGYDMTGESGDCKVNPNNQSRERASSWEGEREEMGVVPCGQSTRIGREHERERERERSG